MLIAAGLSIVAMARPAAAQAVELDIAAATPIFADLDRYLPAAATPHATLFLPSGDARVLPHRSEWDWSSTLRRPDTFEALSMSLVGLTVVDTITTTQALHDGTGRELNPVLAPFAHNTAALVATKAAIDIAVIYFARKIWHRDRQTGINILIGANALTGVAVVRNMAVGEPQVQR
ncbi:MAG TPA: DUF5658 family protein [Vicinamibacterales bacterium]|nr:DUF5658 family protein [Vicinamibacterales bacterium]